MDTFRRCVATLVLIAVIGCRDDDAPTRGEPSPPGPPSTPEEVLSRMIETFDALDAEDYAELLAPEFRFVPPPGDDEIPFTELLRDRDVASTANMFANVQWAELLIQHEGAVSSEHPEFPAEDGFVMIEASRVDVRVLTREIIQGDPLLYLTGGDPMTFVFRALEDTDPPEYVLVQLEEFALISAPATEEINWGRIKALYLPAE